MARRLRPREAGAHASALRERGWCVIEDVVDASEARRVVELLERILPPGRRPQVGYGAKAYSLFARLPELRRLFRESAMHELLGRALAAPPWVVRSGARVSCLDSAPRIPWHHHYGLAPPSLARRKRFERLIAICYLGGSDRENGPLFVRPRAFDDPLDVPPEEALAPLRDEVEISAPPRAAIVMDSALLHASARPSRRLDRWIWGAVARPLDLPRRHVEDESPLDGAYETLRRWKHRLAGEA